MAQVVLGAATPHAPQLRLPIEGWYALREKDETDRRINYQELLAKAKPDMDRELADETLRSRLEACQGWRDQLRDKLAEARPDVLVVVGDDQHEQFHSNNMPMFSIYHGDSVQVGRGHGGRSGSQLWTANKLAEIQEQVRLQLNVPRDHATEPVLAGHLIDALRDDDYDVACSDGLNTEVGLGHAFVIM